MDLRTAQDEALGKVAGISERRPSQVWQVVIRSADALLLAISLLGFAISLAGIHFSGSERVWLELPGVLSRKFGFDFQRSIVGTTVLGGMFFFAAAVLRTWARQSAHSETPTDDRSRFKARLRLCLGNLLHTMALCLLLTRQAAIGTLIATLGLQVLLLYSFQRSGGTVTTWKAREAGRWAWAGLREVYFWGAAVSFVAFGSTYNASRMMQGLLISLGVSIVVRGVLRER